MKLIEAMLSLKPFKRPHSLDITQYFLSKTGPFANLVDCDYFVIYFDGNKDEPEITTALDLYPEDIMADDYELITD